MRTVAFVDNIEFSYSGNLSGKAITVGDLDNDKCNELVIGTINGDVLIFKGSESKPWRQCSGLGVITCLEIGDICTHGKNFLLSLSEEGWCHMFAVNEDQEIRDDEDPDAVVFLKHVHRQRLSANSKCMLIGDIDGDGVLELVVGYTDRRVRAFRWSDSGSVADDGSGGSALHGAFIPLETWQLAGQIGSISLHSSGGAGGERSLMVSQPGGTFVTLYLAGSKIQQGADCGDMKQITLREPSVIFHPLGSARARNPGVTTEVIADIRKSKDGEPDSNYCAICTLDGTITLVDADADDSILWSMYVDHQLFSLTKLDITGDGSEEVVACSWDGQTYIVNLNRDVVRFQFTENVAAFCAGNYAANGVKNVPCLIYATFNNKIKVFKDIRLSEIGTTNLIETMEKNPELPNLLSALNCDESRPERVRQLYEWVLYGTHPNTRIRRDSVIQPQPVILPTSTEDTAAPPGEDST